MRVEAAKQDQHEVLKERLRRVRRRKQAQRGCECQVVALKLRLVQVREEDGR
jgi:hypothetical protein